MNLREVGTCWRMMRMVFALTNVKILASVGRLTAVKANYVIQEQQLYANVGDTQRESST